MIVAHRLSVVLATAVTTINASAVLAQGAGPRTGWSTQVSGLATFQSSTDLESDGSFSATRGFLRLSGLYRMQSSTAVGISASLGKIEYDFDTVGDAPWDGVNDMRLSVPILFPMGETGRVFISPSVRWDYEGGADVSDGFTWGAFGGVSWQVTENLRIGPAFGAFSQIEDNSLEVFPALLVDWSITDRLSLSTGQAAGATQGPGLTLGYELTDALSVSLAGRSENIRFRLDDEGLAPDGVGEDSSLPVVVSLNWAPTPFAQASLFAGAELNGSLRLENSDGTLASEEDYDTAPLAGFAFNLRF